MTQVSAQDAPSAAIERPDVMALRWATAIAALAYGIVLLIMWAPYTLFSGFPYETAFPYMSETGATFLTGFLYTADPLRIHTNTFYHLAYLLGEAVGAGGSYVPHQIVHAALWWARGFLVFLLVRKFFPQALMAAYTAGALVIVHASDGALQWVGQMNQFGFIFWMLLACYTLTCAVESQRRPAVAAALALSACFFCYMSLWSYESQLLLIMVFPVALLARGLFRWRTVGIISSWYVVPTTYIVLTLEKYTAGGSTYQSSVMRQDWGLASLMSDWWFNIAASVKFWTWADSTPRVWSDVLLALGAAAVVAIAGAILHVVNNQAKSSPSLSPRLQTWVVLLVAGVIALVLSFPVYLLLDSARGLWRTQFLSGSGAALVLTALFGLIASRLPARARVAVVLTLACLVVWFGSARALQRGAAHRLIWERHRIVVREILGVAPRVAPGTVIVLTNVPKGRDPFGHNMWLDLAVRLAYPRTPVAGVYFYADGTPSPGNNLKIDLYRWKWDETGYTPDVRESTLDKTVVVALDSDGKGTLAPAIPDSACQHRCESGLYQPAAVISGPVGLRTVRRYRLDAATY